MAHGRQRAPLQPGSGARPCNSVRPGRHEPRRANGGEGRRCGTSSVTGRRGREGNEWVAGEERGVRRHCHARARAPALPSDLACAKRTRESRGVPHSPVAGLCRPARRSPPSTRPPPAAVRFGDRGSGRKFEREREGEGATGDKVGGLRRCCGGLGALESEGGGAAGVGRGGHML
jgi:hypothetical protein